MDDLSAMLSQLLDDPQGMEKIKSLAGSLLGGQADSPAFPSDGPPPNPENRPGQDAAPSPSGDGPLPISPGEIQTIMKLVGAMKNNQDDDRTRLLLSLKPHLSQERQQKVDQAIKLLKLIALLPLVRESGLFGEGGLL